MIKNTPDEKDHEEGKDTPDDILNDDPRFFYSDGHFADTFENFVIERAFEALVPHIGPLMDAPKRRLYIFVVNPNRKVACALPDPLVTGRLSSVLIGRHSRCDIRIDDDPGVSHRHALLVYRTFGYGGSCQVFDLASRTGIFGFDQERIHGFKLIPPFSFLLGRSVVFGLGADSRIAKIYGFRSIPWNRRFGTRSISTPPLDDRPMGMLSARSQHITVNVGLDGDSLDQGVIVGTNPHSPVFEALEYDAKTVSDKHLLFFRHESRVHAVDLRSTNGTTYADCPVAVPLPLPSHGQSRLELGGHSYATWTPNISPPLLAH